jgi:hypothetical protein
VLLQDDDVDAGARQEAARHHSGRAAAGNANLGGHDGLDHGALPASLRAHLRSALGIAQTPQRCRAEELNELCRPRVSDALDAKRRNCLPRAGGAL